MQAHNATSALHESLDRWFRVSSEIPSVALVDHQYIGVCKIGGVGRVECAVHDRPVLGKKFGPVSEPLWIVVLSHSMGLQAGPQVYVHPMHVLARSIQKSVG